jgi:hypothetical protein|tara:strand:- start:434 stop:847 length:414 start_codon:yes stop_codon:yes gene_type:complete
MSRGRPSENVERKTKYNLEFIDYPSKPELGGRSVWHFDDKKSKNGAYKVEQFFSKDEKKEKIKIEKGKAYGKMPVVMVFKTSNRSNAKTKIKVWNNENVDYILTTPKLPGVPSNAIILDVGIGPSFIKSYAKKYDLA